MLGNLARYLDIRLSRMLRRPPRSLPILLLWITDRCNLKCRMCGDQWRMERHADRELLSLSDIAGVIDAARRLKTLVISITGGEPLLHPEIFEILSLINKAGIGANMCSNGTLLTEERVEGLAATSLRSISISLDSPEPDDHDRLRGSQGAFQATVTGIKLLKRAMPGLSININCTVSRSNFRNLPEMVELAASLGCDKISFAPIHTNLQHRDKPKELYADLVFAPEDLDDLQLELERVVELSRRKKIRTSSATFLRGIPRLYRERLRWHTCYAGYASCAISPLGDVAPCVDMESSLNVRQLPLDQIWCSDEFQALREKVDQCRTPCWDTTNTEISIRFSARGLLGGLADILRDFRTYSGKI